MIAIALLGFLVTGSEPNFSNKNILAIHKRNQAKYSKGLGNTKKIIIILDKDIKEIAFFFVS